jgi:hypothetical protein
MTGSGPWINDEEALFTLNHFVSPQIVLGIRRSEAIHFMRTLPSTLAQWFVVGLAVFSGGPCVADETVRAGLSGRPFVEFHARSGPGIFGHSFIVYGTFDHRGHSSDARVAGLYAIADIDLGGPFPMPARVGRAKDDLTGVPEVVYQRELRLSELEELQRAVRRVQASQAPWHLIFFNCNDFLGEIAETIGLRRPMNSIMLPVRYVSLLRALNGDR